MAKGPLYTPAQGAVVKSLDDPKVYFLFGDKKYWIDSGNSFLNLGYKWSWVEDVDQRLIDQYEEGAEISDFDGHPPYVLVKKPGDAKVYRLEPKSQENRLDMVLRHITDVQVFRDLGYRFDRVIELSEDSQYSPFKDRVSVFAGDREIADPIARASDANTIEIPHLYRYVVEELGVTWENDGFTPTGHGLSDNVLSSVSYNKDGEDDLLGSSISFQKVFDNYESGTFTLTDLKEAYEAMETYLQENEESFFADELNR